MSGDPGDEVVVKIEGKEFVTVIDERGVQRFKRNALLCRLVDSKLVNLNSLACAFQHGLFPKDEYAEFFMGLGYSVSGLRDAFDDLEIENPLES